MERLPVLFFFLALLGIPASAQTAGDWSAPDHGLRARLRIEPVADPAVDFTYLVVLELQNVGPDGKANPAAAAQEPITLHSDTETGIVEPKVTDAAGKTLELPGWGGNEIVGPQNLILPFGGTLSFPVGHGGGSVTSAPWHITGRSLFFHEFVQWYVPPTGGPYSLSATLEGAKPPIFPANKPADLTAYEEKLRAYDMLRPWPGELTLPSVKLPEK